MSWGAVIGGAIGLVGGAMAADGARDAASTQAGASLETARIQEAAQLRFEERMQPYIGAGNAADTYINALLGLPAPPAGGTGGAAAGSPDYAAYVNANPDILAAYQAQAGGNEGGSGGLVAQGANILRGPSRSLEAFGRWHWQTYGQNEGRQLPTVGPSTPPATQGENYDAAMAAYENSPWARFAASSADTSRRNATESFTSTAGARGSLVSGRTAAGLYDIAQEAEDQRFREGFTQGWYPAMTGVSDRGYNASVGAANSSLSTAANMGAAGERAAAATAEGQRAANDAWASGINSALYYAGQGFDTVTNRQNTSKVSTPNRTKGSTSGGGTKTTAKNVYSGG